MFRSAVFCTLLLLSGLAQAQVTLLTSIKPLQFIAESISQGSSQVDVLLPPGASPHHYALRPSDMVRLEQADLFYWIGPDMESFLPRVLERRNKPSVAVQNLPKLTLLHFEQGHDDHDEQGHNHSHDHDHEHAPGSLDTHLWLSSTNAAVIAEQMAADLARIDPANAAQYQANLVQFKQQLSVSDGKIKQQLSQVQAKPFFVFHESLNYFEHAYGLKHAGVFAISAEVQPGARHVQQMRDRLTQAGASCIFTEPPAQPRLAQTLSAGLPVSILELDPLGSNLKVSATAYNQMLENLAQQMAQCLNQ